MIFNTQSSGGLFPCMNSMTSARVFSLSENASNSFLSARSCRFIRSFSNSSTALSYFVFPWLHQPKPFRSRKFTNTIQSIPFHSIPSILYFYSVARYKRNVQTVYRNTFSESLEQYNRKQTRENQPFCVSGI